jgi:hypothetical protein
MITTREQREKLFQLFWRQSERKTYRAFRKDAQPTIGCDGAIVVPWNGMWVCIERDGYSHT